MSHTIAILFHLLLLQPQAVDFRCDVSTLSSVTEKVKPYVKSSSYQTLLKLKADCTEEMKKLSDPSNPRDLDRLSVQYCTRLRNELPGEEYVLFCAMAQTRHGFLSLKDRHVLKYLSASPKQVKEVTAAVTDYVEFIEKKGVQHSQEPATAVRKVYEDALKYHETTFSPSLQTIFSKEQLNLLKKVLPDESQKAALLLNVTRIGGDAVQEQDILKVRRIHCPNVRHVMPARGLILVDLPAFRRALQLSKEQEQQLYGLYESYSIIADDLQGAFIETLKTAKRDPTKFFIDMARKQGDVAGKKFLSILTVRQQKRLTEVMGQVHGSTYAFGSDFKSRMSISDDQQKGILKFCSDVQSNFAIKPTADDIEYDFEYAYKLERAIDDAVFNNYFTDEQRTEWNKLLGEKIPDAELKELRMKYIERTNLNVKVGK